MPGGRLPMKAARSWPAASLLALAAARALAQDVAVTRQPRDSNLAVRLENLSSQVMYDRSGGTYFVVPTGRYSVQLVRDGRLVYQEVEYIGADAPQTRTVDPSGSGITVGLSDGNTPFDATVCSALEEAARLAVSRFGLHDGDIQRRLSNAGPGDWQRCATQGGLDEFATILAGSYGATPLGMVGLTIEFIPLAQRGPPRRVANPNLDGNSARPAISPAQQPNAALNAGLVNDLKNGFSDVAVEFDGKPMLVCAALDANTPLFCDSDATVMAPTENTRLHGLYRFRVKTTPVDYRGVEEDRWTTFAGEDEYHATQERLARAMGAIQSGLRQRIAQLEAKPDAPGSSGAGGRGYSTTDLSALIETTQAEIDQALREETLQPLAQASSLAGAAQIDPTRPFVPAASAHRIFQQIEDRVALLAQVAGSLGIDFVFRTTPVESGGTRLTFANCDRCPEVLSQGGVHRFYRGRYYIKANLDGYVPYEGWLDLVADPRTILECEMVRARRSTSGRGSSCALKTQ